MNWLIVMMFVLFAGCSREPISKDLPAQNIQTSPKAMDLPAQPRKLSKGEALFIRHCADCHGWEGRGSGPSAAYLGVPMPVLQRREIVYGNSEQQFVDWVLHGLTLELPVADGAGLKKDSEVAALLAHIRRLPVIDWVKIYRGQEVYDELCIGCHGLYGRGDGDWAFQMSVPLPDLRTSDFQNQYTDEELLQIITNGKNAMPGMKEILHPVEINNVIAFLRLLSPGYESYDRFCAACHEENGDPTQLESLEEESEFEYAKTDIPVFDEDYLNSLTDTQLMPKIQHMLKENSTRMPHFDDDLKPDEVRLIYRYLRALIAESS